MTDDTPLDLAHDAMEAGGDVDRLRFYERLADSEMFMMLAADPEGDGIEPQTFPVDGETYVLVFDRIERMAEFAAKTTPYAALSGRAIINLLDKKGVGLGVNLGVARSSILLPAAVIDWLAQTIAVRPQEMTEKPTELHAPRSVPQEVLTGLDVKLALAAGLARSAFD